MKQCENCGYIQGFAKRPCDEAYVEGYLSSKEKFNGVLFVLREPNHKEKDAGFWFKDMLDKEKKNSQTGKVKGQATKYEKYFKILLKFLGIEEKLDNSAYANIRPYDGEAGKSKEYKCMSDENKKMRLYSLIEECKPKIVFITIDIADILNKDKEWECISEEGIAYENNKLRLLKSSRYPNIKVYEIYHPSCWCRRYKVKILG